MTTSLSLLGVTLGSAEGPGRPLTLGTTAGDIPAVLYPAEPALAALLWLADRHDVPRPLAEQAAALGVLVLVPGHREGGGFADQVLDAMVAAHVIGQLADVPLAVLGEGGGAAIAVELQRLRPDLAAAATLAPTEASGLGVVTPDGLPGWLQALLS